MEISGVENSGGKNPGGKNPVWGIYRGGKSVRGIFRGGIFSVGKIPGGKNVGGEYSWWGIFRGGINRGGTFRGEFSRGEIAGHLFTGGSIYRRVYLPEGLFTGGSLYRRDYLPAGYYWQVKYLHEGLFLCAIVFLSDCYYRRYLDIGI